MRYVNKLICLFIALSFSSIQALPSNTVKDPQQEIHLSDSGSNSIQAVPQDPMARKSLTTGQAIGIGAGCVVVTGIILVAIVYHSLSHMYDGMTFNMM